MLEKCHALNMNYETRSFLLKTSATFLPRDLAVVDLPDRFDLPRISRDIQSREKMELMYCEGCDFDFPSFSLEVNIAVKIREARRYRIARNTMYSIRSRGDATIACAPRAV